MSSAWLRPMLDMIGQAHAPRPVNPTNIVEIPGGLDKLRRTIDAVLREQQGAMEQLSDYQNAWVAATKEYDAAIAKNAATRRNIEIRLYRLRCEWASISRDMGLEMQPPAPPEGVSFSIEDGR